MLSSCFCLVAEPALTNDSLVLFIAGNPNKQEITNQITKELKNNVEKGQKIYERRKTFIECSSGQSRAWSELYWANTYYLQKRLELSQWQYKNAENDESRKEAAQKIIVDYENLLESAQKFVQTSAESGKAGAILLSSYLAGENLHDRIALEAFTFKSTNPEVTGEEKLDTKDGLTARILQMLENNLERAEKINREYKEETETWKMTKTIEPGWLRARELDLLQMKFHVLQKQSELYQWQHQNAKDAESRKIAAGNLMDSYEQQLAMLKEMIVMSRELSWRYITWGEYLRYESMLDQTMREKLKFLETQQPSDNISGQIARMLQDNVDQGKRIYDGYENEYQKVMEEKMKAGLKASRTRTPTFNYGLFQTEYYYQQKQLELLLWQFRNAEEDTVRKEIAEKVMEIYQAQWETAKKLSKIAADFWDAGAITMKDYLDCETMLDQTTFNYLHFTLKNE